MIGSAALLVGARIDYHRWARMVPTLVLGALALLVAVLIPDLGLSVNGAQRWIGVGFIQLQPAEPAKFALIAFCAALVARNAHRVHEGALPTCPARFSEVRLRCRSRVAPTGGGRPQRASRRSQRQPA